MARLLFDPFTAGKPNERRSTGNAKTWRQSELFSEARRGFFTELSLSNDGELLGLTKLFAKYKFDPDQINLILLQKNALMLRLRIAKSLVLVFSRENQREYSRVNDKIYARLISCI